MPLLVVEAQTPRVRQLRDEDSVVVWWATPVECASALWRRRREGLLDPSDVQAATARLRGLAQSWIEVPPSNQVREQALRLLRLHTLRAADALQLGAALVTSDFKPNELEFVTLDPRLAEAAEREGFRTLS